MDSPTIKEEPEWNPHMLEPLEHVETRSPSPKSESFEVKSATAASTSVNSNGDRKTSIESRGRRSKPSVAYSLPLPSKSEKKQHKEARALSNESTLQGGTLKETPSIAVKSISEENIVSSRDVRRFYTRKA